jgi:hypothetical protein
MSFLKHVGKQGDRKVAIIFREVPGEPHMALVTYTETLNQHIHGPLIKCIESAVGQSAESLSDALSRTLGVDGRPLLNVLHVEGLLKKVNTESITVIPNPQTKIKLSELNKLLSEMKQGSAAVARMVELDKSRGMQDPKDVRRRTEEFKNNAGVAKDSLLKAPDNSVLGDSAIANDLRVQAAKMEAEAKGLLAESQYLLKQAADMDPPATKVVKTTKVPKAKKSTEPVSQ